jgi:hypothetical protein
MKIHTAMIEILRDAGAITKNRRNAQQGYDFRGIDDVYNELHDIMAKHGVFTTSKILDHKREERTTGKGSQLFYSIVTIEYTFWAEDGSSMVSTVIGEGMDSGDKATNKAMAVAHKYVLLQAFAIPTLENKDPENDSHTVTAPSKPAPVPATAAVPAPQNTANLNPGETVFTGVLVDVTVKTGKTSKGKPWTAHTAVLDTGVKAGTYDIDMGQCLKAMKGKPVEIIALKNDKGYYQIVDCYLIQNAGNAPSSPPAPAPVQTTAPTRTAPQQAAGSATDGTLINAGQQKYLAQQLGKLNIPIDAFNVWLNVAMGVNYMKDLNLGQYQGVLKVMANTPTVITATAIQETEKK